MAHERRHRGTHPEDASFFSDQQIPKLREALSEYCWLLSRHYATASSLKLVGDKFQLSERQRMLLMRSACSDSQRTNRQTNQVDNHDLQGQQVFIDGFNLLITIESALSDAYVFVGQDGCYRDLASVHGTYKRVQETLEAVNLTGRVLSDLKVEQATWLLDKPVSNSGRLKQILDEQAVRNSWNWHTELHPNPDDELSRVDGIVISTDSVILDSAKRWFHLNACVIHQMTEFSRLVDLRSLTA